MRELYKATSKWLKGIPSYSLFHLCLICFYLLSPLSFYLSFCFYLSCSAHLPLLFSFCAAIRSQVRTWRGMMALLPGPTTYLQACTRSSAKERSVLNQVLPPERCADFFPELLILTHFSISALCVEVLQVLEG